MARIFITLFVVFVFIIPENEAASYSIPVPSNWRIQALKGRKCLNFLWDRPCDHPYCKITLQYKIARTGFSVGTLMPSPYKPATINNSTSFIQCFYDTISGENVSCCNSVSPGANLASGEGTDLSYYKKISFHVKVCLNDSGTCVSKPYWFDFILPWHNPCFFENQCQNFGTCQPLVDAYNCSCTSEWQGTNCTRRRQYIDNGSEKNDSVTQPSVVLKEEVKYHANKCLDYSSDADDVKHSMKTPLQCKDECTNLGSAKCKSFEFKKMPSGNLGNCTLRDSNSLKHNLVACDADLYELEKDLKVNKAPTVAIVTLHLLIMLLVGIFMAE